MFVERHEHDKLLRVDAPSSLLGEFLSCMLASWIECHTNFVNNVDGWLDRERKREEERGSSFWFWFLVFGFGFWFLI